MDLLGGVFVQREGEVAKGDTTQHMPSKIKVFDSCEKDVIVFL